MSVLDELAWPTTIVPQFERAMLNGSFFHFSDETVPFAMKLIDPFRLREVRLQAECRSDCPVLIEFFRTFESDVVRVVDRIDLRALAVLPDEQGAV